MATSTILRQGVNGTAVVRITLADITRPLRGAELAAAVDSPKACKAIAQDMARIFMVGAGWGGRILTTRTTLSACGTYYSVSVKHVKQ